MSGLDLPGVAALTRSDTAVGPMMTGDRAARADGGGAASTHRQDRNLDVPERECAGQSHQSCQPGLPSSVIHELRTPLTSIHGYSQLLQRTLNGNPRAANALSVVVRETTRLTSMLEELSELAEPEADGLPSTSAEMRLDEIVDGVIAEIVQQDAGAHPITMHGKSAARSDPRLLSRALFHLLANATKYSDAGSPIWVTIGQSNGVAVVDVQDEGIGIEPEDAERIYLPFERGSNARRAGVRGLGLGLFLARRALSAIDAALQHGCTNGHTTFRVTVPAH